VAVAVIKTVSKNPPKCLPVISVPVRSQESVVGDPNIFRKADIKVLKADISVIYIRVYFVAHRKYSQRLLCRTLRELTAV
jgi:hypothetical protein